MQKKFVRSLEQLDRVFEFVAVFTDKNSLDSFTRNAINLAVEEIFTNMIKYNPDITQAIQLEMRLQEQEVIVTMTDYEEEPFDLTTIKVYDLEKSLEDRPVGKLGLHLVKKVMDKIEYSHRDGKTVIIMVKHLGEKNA